MKNSGMPENADGSLPQYSLENGAALLMIEKYAGLCPPGRSCSSMATVTDSYGVSSISVP